MDGGASLTLKKGTKDPASGLQKGSIFSVPKKEVSGADALSAVVSKTGVVPSVVEAAREFGVKPGQLTGPLGRVSKVLSTGETVTVSARLMSKSEIAAALVNDDVTDDVTATLSDVVDAIGEDMAGGRRKLRGGGKTYDALAALFTDTSNKFSSGLEWADEKVGTAVKSIPFLLKTVATGTTLKFALNHPSLFANIVDLAKQVGQYLVQVDPDGATWTQYYEAGKSIGGSMVELLGTAAQQPTTPAGTILLALFIMKYRSWSSQKSLTTQIKDDAAVVKTLAGPAVSGISQAALAQYSAFLKAYDQGAQEVAFGKLKEIAQNIKPVGGPAAKKITSLASGVPSVQSGPDGTIITVPTEKEKDFKEIMEKLAKANIPPKEKAAAAAIVGDAVDQQAAKVPVAAIQAPRTRAPGLASLKSDQGKPIEVDKGKLSGGVRKTRKPKSKRRVTRRRKVQKVLGAPVFVY